MTPEETLALIVIISAGVTIACAHWYRWGVKAGWVGCLSVIVWLGTGLALALGQVTS